MLPEGGTVTHNQKTSEERPRLSNATSGNDQDVLVGVDEASKRLPSVARKQRRGDHRPANPANKGDSS